MAVHFKTAMLDPGGTDTESNSETFRATENVL